MGVCHSTGANADEAWSSMPQKKVDKSMNDAVATKMERVPELDREREWSAAEIAALSSTEQPWETVTDDPRGLRFDYPTAWQLVGPRTIGVSRYERLVRTAHVLNKTHIRCSAEMSIGFAHFNPKKPRQKISLETYDKMTAQIEASSRKVEGCILLTSEKLDAGVFKGSKYPVVHTISKFAQPDGTTSRVEQWMLLSVDRTTQCVLTTFNSDLPAAETYGAMQHRFIKSVELPKGQY